MATVTTQSHPLVVVSFVNGRSRRDKELEDAQVRSHAAKISHARRKNTKVSLTVQINPPVTKESYARRHSSQASLPRPERTRPLQDCQCTGTCKCVGLPSRHTPTIQHGWQARSITRGDPFASFAGHDAPPICHDALDYAFENAWLGLLAPLWSTSRVSLKFLLKNDMVNSSSLFYTYSASATALALSLIGDQEGSVAMLLRKTQLEQYQLAIRRLSSEISSANFRPTDDHINAVLMLARHTKNLQGSDEGAMMPPPPEPYPITPLGAVQSLYLMGNLDYAPSHVTAIYNMISMKGGIATTELHTRNVLQLHDISVSTRAARPPRFPFVVEKVKIAEVHPEVASIPLQIGARFHGIHLASIRNVSEQLYELLSRMLQLTKLVDLHSDDLQTGLHVRTLILARTEVQHSLLAYDTSQYGIKDFYSGKLTRTQALCEVIRLAAMIYSDMVLFPHPWKTGVKTQLAKRMHFVWKSGVLQQLPGETHACTELHMWLLCFGCFGAVNSEYREWFELELYRVMDEFYGLESDSLSFDCVKVSLRGFLWWDPICDVAGRELWDRIQSWAENKRLMVQLASNLAGGSLPIRMNLPTEVIVSA